MRLVRVLNRIGLTTWKRRVVAAVVAMPVVGFASAELTSQSWFCNSCHIMNPYYDSWKRGSHKDIACVECHISPGVNNFLAAKFNGLGQVVDDVLHRTSMKPSASVSDLACTRSGCHDTGRLKATTSSKGSFLFRHDKHLGMKYQGIQIECATCHSHVKGVDHFQVDTNVCVTCHLLQSPERAAGNGTPTDLLQMLVRDGRSGAATHPASNSAPPSAPPALANGPGTAANATAGAKIPPATCVSCHSPPTKTIERGGLKINHSEYLSFGAACESCHRGNTAAPVPIDSGMCYACHTFGLEKRVSTAEMHELHTGGRHKIECFSCHGTVHHGPATQTARLAQLDCRECHVGQHVVQRQSYLQQGEMTAAVSPMFMAHVDCTGCHISPRAVSVKPHSGATVNAAVPEACDRCHKPGYGQELISLWQKTTRSMFEQLTKDIEAAEGRVTTSSGKQQLDDARRIQDMIKVDGSWGVHNPKYTQQLIEHAREQVRSAVSGEAGKQ